MNIKVVKCSKDTYWYHNSIGTIFEVVAVRPNDSDEHYRVIRDRNTESSGFVQKEDAVVLLLEKFNTLTSIVEQLEFCGYVTEDHLHSLKDNTAFISLKEMAKKE